MPELPWRDVGLILTTSLAGAVLVGVPGALVLHRLRGRSITASVFVLLTIAVLAVLAGVVGIAQAMFISPHDRDVLLVVVAGSAAVSLPIAWWLGRRLAADAVWADQMRA